MPTDIKSLNAKFFNELAQDIHNNENKKWWFDKDGNPVHITLETLLMLVVTELAEAVEGVRKGGMDDKLTHRTNFEVELADAALRCLDLMVGKNTHKFTGNYGRVHSIDLSVPKQDHLFRICKSVIEFYNVETIVFELLDLAYNYDIDLIEVMMEKRAYNQSRLDHSFAEREKEGGKKF